jgi:hypothetical protein
MNVMVGKKLKVVFKLVVMVLIGREVGINVAIE